MFFFFFSCVSKGNSCHKVYMYVEAINVLVDKFKTSFTHNLNNKKLGGISRILNTSFLEAGNICRK